MTATPKPVPAQEPLPRRHARTPAEQPAAESPKPGPRPKVPMRSYIPTNYLSPQQAADLRTIVDTYIPDLHDPAAVEVLLVLLEVCHILDVSDYRMRQIFGSRQLHALETWGDIVPPKRRPTHLHRAWVWPPNTNHPQLYPVTPDGTIRLYPPPPDAAIDDPPA